MVVNNCSEKGLKSPILIRNLQQGSSWAHILLLVRNHAPLNFDAVLALGCLAVQPCIEESCLHLSKPYFFFHSLVQRLFHKSQGVFFSLPICRHLTSLCQQRQNVTRHSSSLNQCAISNSIYFFYPLRSLVQVPNSVPFCTVPGRQCGTFEKGDIFQQKDSERLRFVLPG